MQELAFSAEALKKGPCAGRPLRLGGENLGLNAIYKDKASKEQGVVRGSLKKPHFYRGQLQ